MFETETDAENGAETGTEKKGNDRKNAGKGHVENSKEKRKIGIKIIVAGHGFNCGNQ